MGEEVGDGRDEDVEVEALGALLNLRSMLHLVEQQGPTSLDAAHDRLPRRSRGRRRTRRWRRPRAPRARSHSSSGRRQGGGDARAGLD